MKPLVVVTHWVNAEVLALLKKSCRVIANSTRESWPRPTLLRHAAKADAVMAFMPDRIDNAFLKACPNLKVVGAALKGFDNIDVEACSARDVRVTIVPDLLTVPAAELTIGMMITLGRNVFAGDERVRSGAFEGWRPVLYGTGLAGETVGLLGMGAIGRAIAERLAPFGVRMLYYDARPLARGEEKAVRVERASLTEILKQSRYVVVGLPLNAETVHAIDAAALRKMRRDGFLINIGRGSVVDENAVAAALRGGRLAGYATDVFEFEDLSRADRPRDIPAALRRAPNTLLLPHLGSAVKRVREEIALSAARSLLAVLAGKVPGTCVNP